MFKKKDTVLIVEEKTSDMLISSALFNYLGYDVLTSSHESKVIDLVQCRKIDLLLINVTLPELKGIRLAQTIRQITPQAKIILNSDQPANHLSEVNSFMSEFNFLQKPFWLTDISKIIKETDFAKIN